MNIDYQKENEILYKTIELISKSDMITYGDIKAAAKRAKRRVDKLRETQINDRTAIGGSQWK